ncbi:hypothetical protein [Microbulbifer sp. 2205BS26-8]|uniref:hypothetical protein n=1 Tax=Microbulbifer sp. 2205BS26-8 TaxID=3064386 RepID=UPI00273D7357|nr:hypothetical protein [Microbulbifer sp. 2205BS26-8]MDP5210849.1 hypothetical protein [Microbulbifer sp. 2205BS26-8]
MHHFLFGGVVSEVFVTLVFLLPFQAVWFVIFQQTNAIQPFLACFSSLAFYLTAPVVGIAAVRPSAALFFKLKHLA